MILCERGIRTFETAYRFTLDLLAIPALRELTHLPIVVDPSHAPGRRDWVPAMSMAAAAAGADGIIVEVHNDPEHAICDGPQALATDGLRRLRGPGTARGRGRGQAGLDCLSERREDRGPRRRPDRRLDRARRAAAPGRRGGRLRLATPANARARRSSSGRSIAAPRLGRRGGRRCRASCSAPRRSGRCPSWSPRRSPATGERAVVTDVGSTKRELIERARRARRSDAGFIGGHPLAGAETAGVENARAELLEGARWYLTPTERSSGLHYDLLQSTRRRPRRPAAGDRAPTTHDRVMATVSHLPHVLANVLVGEAADGALGGLRAAARGRDQLPRHDPGRGRQPGDLGRHLRHQPRGGRRRASTRSAERLRGRRRADPLRRPRGGRRLARERRRRPAPAARGRPRRRRPAASCGSGSRTGPGPSPRSRWRSATPRSTSRTWRSTRRPTCAPGRSRSGSPAPTRPSAPSAIVRELGHVVARRRPAADDPLRPGRRRCAARSPRRRTSRSPTGRRSSPRWARARPSIAQLPRRRRHALDPGRGPGASAPRSSGEPAAACGSRGVGLRGARAGGDRRRQRRHPAAAAARLARRPARRRVDARRRRVDPPPPGRPGGRAAAADGRRRSTARDDRLPPLGVRGADAARDRVPAARSPAPR